MRAWIARMTEDNIDQSAIEKAGEILKNGGLAAFPTETVYGLGGNALDAKAHPNRLNDCEDRQACFPLL